jgi:hypothetical protein
MGSTIAASYGIYKSLPTMENPSAETIDSLFLAYTKFPTTNQKRYSSPTATNWQSYCSGEVSSAMGKLISCPSSNIKVFNMDAKVVNELDFNSAYELIVSQISKLDGWSLLSDEIDPEEIKELIRD